MTEKHTKPTIKVSTLSSIQDNDMRTKQDGVKTPGTIHRLAIEAVFLYSLDDAINHAPIEDCLNEIRKEMLAAMAARRKEIITNY